MRALAARAAEQADAPAGLPGAAFPETAREQLPALRRTLRQLCRLVRA